MKSRVIPRSSAGRFPTRRGGWDGLVVDARVDQALGAGFDQLEQAFDGQGGVKTISIWVEVSSAETISAIHFRDTRSSTTVTATPALVKCDVS